jgi:hypothetical protein
MSMLKLVATSVAVGLMVCSVATAQAQSKRMVVAMAPTDQSVSQDAKPAQPASQAMSAPRAKRVAAAQARSASPDCFWCNRTVYISGVTF